jgi:hypothetical protein
MSAFYKIIIYDYKQRTRSYAFLVTLAISLYAAYSFVPAPNAAYSTVRVGGYIGVQNAAWIGYVTAMMTSVFLCWIGFYLVNSGIKKDIDTGVGAIIATTAVSNFSYLLAKTWSNFLVLLSIVGCVFLMAITLFFIRAGGYPFQISRFILPYLLITIPAIFFTAALAVVAEVFLYRYTIVMNVAYFIFFCTVVSLQVTLSSQIDIIGSKPVFAAMQQTVFQQSHDASQAVSMGFLFGSRRHFHYFEFDGINWTAQIIFSRLILVCFALSIVFISSRFFHRFEIKQKFKAKKKANLSEIIPNSQPLRDIKLSALPSVTPAYGIMPFIKTELLMLIRKGPRWLWLINLGGMIALVFAPLTIAHQMILPILWFLQVGRWSDLATKEKTNRIHYFTYASYKPLSRLLPAQIIAGIVLALTLAFPLLLRYLVRMQFLPILSIIMGGVFIVLFAVAFGILSGGKKLFEILFFLFTYANIEKIPFLDYFGGMNKGMSYTLLIAGFIGFFALLSFMLRRMEIRRV